MAARAEASSFESVHFVEGFVDGVLNGTADYRGTPHHFVLRSAEPNHAEVYQLTPLSPEVFAAVSEAWGIWQRWQQAQHGAPPDNSTLLLALPEDRERQAELRGYISNWLLAAKSSAFLAEGDFEQVATDDGRASLRVKWSRLEEKPGHLTTG